MNVQIFQGCFQELMKRTNNNKIQFLRYLTELSDQQRHKQIYLAFYAFYQLVYKRNHKKCLQSIQHGLSLEDFTVPSIMLMAIKSLLLTQMEKHNEALFLLKQIIRKVRQMTKMNIVTQQIYKKCFPTFMSSLVSLFNVSRGKRQFLIVLNEIKKQIQGKQLFNSISEAIDIRILQIRQRTGCLDKKSSSKSIRLASSSKSLKKQIVTHQKSPKNYINALYQQRRSKISQRKGQNRKKIMDDPYQLNLSEKEQNQCFLM